MATQQLCRRTWTSFSRPSVSFSVLSSSSCSRPSSSSSLRSFSATAAAPAAPAAPPAAAASTTAATPAPSSTPPASPRVQKDPNAVRLPKLVPVSEVPYGPGKLQTIYPNFPAQPMDYFRMQKDRRKFFDPSIMLYQLSNQTAVSASRYKRNPHMDLPSKKYHRFRILVGSWLNTQDKSVFVTLTGGNTVTIGITNTHIESLAFRYLRPVKVSFPAVGASFKQGQTFATIHCASRESIMKKSTKSGAAAAEEKTPPKIVANIEVSAPVDLTVLRANGALNKTIFMLAEKPEQGGWLVSATFDAPEQMETLFEFSPPGRLFYQVMGENHGKREIPFWKNEVPVDYWQKKKAAAKDGAGEKEKEKKAIGVSEKTAKAAKIAA